jgi:hypothetical protein
LECTDVASTQHGSGARNAKECAARETLGVGHGGAGENFGAVNGEIHANALRVEHTHLRVHDHVGNDVVVAKCYGVHNSRHHPAPLRRTQKRSYEHGERVTVEDYRASARLQRYWLFAKLGLGRGELASEMRKDSPALRGIRAFFDHLIESSLSPFGEAQRIVRERLHDAVEHHRLDPGRVQPRELLGRVGTVRSAYQVHVCISEPVKDLG